MLLREVRDWSLHQQSACRARGRPRGASGMCCEQLLAMLTQTAPPACQSVSFNAAARSLDSEHRNQGSFELFGLVVDLDQAAEREVRHGDAHRDHSRAQADM